MPHFLHVTFLLQALVKNAEKYHITKDQKINWEIIKLFISLAFLPEELIKEGFILITQVILSGKHNKEMEKFIKYYENTWIHKFKPSSFSIFKHTHRTNNITERHNRELKESLKKHSTIVDFLSTHYTIQLHTYTYTTLDPE